jgi:hypothetical protein
MGNMINPGCFHTLFSDKSKSVSHMLNKTVGVSGKTAWQLIFSVCESLVRLLVRDIDIHAFVRNSRRGIRGSSLPLAVWLAAQRMFALCLSGSVVLSFLASLLFLEGFWTPQSNPTKSMSNLLQGKQLMWSTWVSATLNEPSRHGQHTAIFRC